MIGKNMIIQTICSVFQDKVIKLIDNDREGWSGRVKIAGRTFHISICEEKEEQ